MRNPFQRIRDFFRQPAMIGEPPSERSIWHDPKKHARDFAERYAEPMNYHVENRMTELGIDPARIGVGDAAHGIRHAAFMPHETDGGGNTPDGRLNLDSGILNPDLFKRLGPEASVAYAKARLRDRMDAGIAHEFEELKGGGRHEYAFEHAPETELPIRHEARELARKIRDGERRRARSPIPPGAPSPRG